MKGTVTNRLSDYAIGEAVATAEHKLALIIKSEGGADGVRYEAWYFDMLVSEELRSMKYAEKFSQKINKSPVGEATPTRDRT